MGHFSGRLQLVDINQHVCSFILVDILLARYIQVLLYKKMSHICIIIRTGPKIYTNTTLTHK